MLYKDPYDEREERNGGIKSSSEYGGGGEDGRMVAWSFR